LKAKSQLTDYLLEKDEFNMQIAELKRMKKDNDPNLFTLYQEMLNKYGEPERVAYNMRMESICEEAKSEHLIIRSNSDEKMAPKEQLLLTQPENLVLI
jgi:hypothetical protein